MDTNQAILTLQALLITIQGNATGFQGQADALKLSLDQLNGILQTQALDLENQYRGTINSKDLELVQKNIEIDTLKQTIADLQALITPVIDPIIP